MSADPSHGRGLGTRFAAALRLRPAPPRWPYGLRAAVSTLIPILVGWAAGDVAAGLIATLGAFTCRFGAGRPYLDRGVHLAVIAVALAGAVTLGAWAAPAPAVAVATVTAIAVVAVWLCAALSVGPPGAYVFVIVCAAGVGVSASHLPPWRIGALVLAGGATAWATHMVGALVDGRAPERAAVRAAGDAVAAAVADAGGTDATTSRARAAGALYRAWTVLVSQQRWPTRAGSTLDRLRAASHALHVLFADAMRSAAAGRPVAPGTAATALGLGALSVDPSTVAPRDPRRTVLAPPPVRELLAEAVAAGAQTRRVMWRVAVAAPMAGAAAVAVGAGHPYWAIAAAVLVLHAGADRRGTLRKGAERLAGTWVGLALAAAILLVHPQGVALAVVVAALQFVIELLVVRNYALASVFITAAALTVSSAAHPVDVAGVLVDRGLDTLLGCAVGVAVYLVTAPRQETNRVPAAVADVLEQTAVVAGHLGAGTTPTLAARAARRDLHRRIVDLAAALDAAAAGTVAQQRRAADLTRSVVAAEHLGQLTIAGCWAAEHDPSFEADSGIDPDADPESGVDASPDASPDAYVARLRRLADAARRGEDVSADLVATSPMTHRRS